MLNKLDIRVYPLKNPKGNTLSFASVSIDNLVVIRGIRVVSGRYDLFVSMPQSKDKNGNHHDIVSPLSNELQKAINDGVLAEHNRQTGVDENEMEGTDHGVCVRT